jgi:hypothetical protein
MILETLYDDTLPEIAGSAQTMAYRTNLDSVTIGRFNPDSVMQAAGLRAAHRHITATG